MLFFVGFKAEEGAQLKGIINIKSHSEISDTVDQTAVPSSFATLRLGQGPKFIQQVCMSEGILRWCV